MKQTQGAPPVTLCVVTTVILSLHLTAIVYVKYEVPKLEARVRQATVTPVLRREYEDDKIPLSYRPSGTLSGNAGMLAGLREIDGALPHYLWLTGFFFLGSLLWLKAPRTN